jgi:hypothetical protein
LIYWLRILPTLLLLGRW